jgi:hypothetical protein
MHTIYRISDGGYKKEKLEFADKFYCLENYLSVFGNDNLVLFADNCKEETLERLRKYPIRIFESNEGSSAKSWRMVAEYAMKEYSNNELVYFLEDDYLHLKGAKKCLEEGLEIADYVTLYDHPDKYLNPKEGGNPMVVKGGEYTQVLLTKSTHWKITNSTTMTFASKISTLKEDWEIWDEFTKGSLPSDDQIFLKLQSLKKLKYKLFGKNRKLISPIPSMSTHVEKKWLAPLIDWKNI